MSADPINKYNLLSMVADIYGHNTRIIKDTDLKIDRSLDSTRFQAVTGLNQIRGVRYLMKNFR